MIIKYACAGLEPIIANKNSDRILFVILDIFTIISFFYALYKVYEVYGVVKT